MRKRKTFVAMGIFIAVLVLGVGYAAISNVDLTLNGTANVKANADFSVVFDETHDIVVTPNSETVQWDDSNSFPVASGAYTNEASATMTVYLDASNRNATAVYKVLNNSDELKATLTADVTTNFDTNADEYLTVTKELYSNEECTAVLSDSELIPNGEAYLKVSVSLDKLPVEDIANETFTITVTATPVDSDEI